MKIAALCSFADRSHSFKTDLRHKPGKGDIIIFAIYLAKFGTTVLCADVIYARYSSDRQTEQSIDGQIHVCMEYAERNDIVIVGTYIDRAMTGTNDNREQFQKMLKDSDKKPFDYVLVYKLDRFSRNKYEMAIHRKHLKDNGIKILSAMENIPDTPEGILLESLLEGSNSKNGQSVKI